jgi:putative transposase
MIKPDKSFLRDALQLTLQSLMEMDVSAALDAGYYERNQQRLAYRNGYRERGWRSSVGEITLRVPKLRKGSYYPDFLFDAEAPILDFLSDAYWRDVTPEKVEALLRRLDIPPHQIIEFCDHLHHLIETSRQRPLEDVYPCVWLEVDNGRWIALGFRANGSRELLGIAPDSHTLLQDLKKRGLKRVEVLTGDDESARDAALIFPKSDWQHYERELPYHRLIVAYPAITIAIARYLTATRRFSVAQMFVGVIPIVHAA